MLNEFLHSSLLWHIRMTNKNVLVSTSTIDLGKAFLDALSVSLEKYSGKV